MANIHPFMLLVFVLLAAVGLTQVPNLASAPDALRMGAGRMETGPMASAQAAAEPVDPGQAEAATAQGGGSITPNHDPHLARLGQPPAVETVATPNHDPHLARLGQPPATATVAAAEHDPGDVSPMPSFVVNTVTLQAEPEPAARPAAAASAAAPADASDAVFVEAETTLYAKDGARLRAAPSKTADIVTKLAADARLLATGRSADGAWWRVSLAGPADEPGRIGYVHQIAVTKDRVVTLRSPAAAAPVAAVAPVPARRNQGLLSTVDEAVNWFTEAADRGSTPSAIRPER